VSEPVLPRIPAVGEKLSGFRITEVHELDEFRAKGIRARHDATGMEVYHVASEDEENLFAFAFKSLPSDSTGVAHILEHTVLCGSERFPVKDPFLLLLKGSMNTFLNAFTYPDKTVYPASSTVHQDLFNLLEVYGDAVFFPRISREMFRQEGHRLEFGPDGKLIRTGVVYNEMKGNYSSHESVAAEWCFRSLFPDTAYAHDSGGDPAKIPDLTYEDFVAFHHKNYHPSNTLLFVYGNIPTQDYLSFISDKFLSRFPAVSLSTRPTAYTKIPVKPFSEPKRLTVTYPSGPEDEEGDAASITLNWMLPSIDNPVAVLAREILSELLIGSAASPLQRALVDSELGEDLSSPTGLETEIERMCFSAGLRGTSAGREADIEKVIQNALSTIVQDGFDRDLVEGTLRRFEFRAREIKGGPFGLRLALRSLRAWLHGAPPDLSLRFVPRMVAIREAMAATPRYFEKLVETDLLSNPHRTTVTVVPDAEQNRREAEAEAAKLAAIEAGLSPTERERILQDQKTLEAIQHGQERPEDVATIPFLKEKDIPRAVRTFPFTTTEIPVEGSSIPVHSHDLYTNGIAYADLLFEADGIPAEDLAFLPFLLSAISNLGLPDTSYEQTATRLNLLTGGFSASCESSPTVDGSLRVFVTARFKVLEANIKEAVRLCTTILTQADFSDTKRLADLFTENRNENRSSLLPSGNGYAVLRNERYLSKSEALEELWRGVTQIQLLESLGRTLGDKLPDFLSEVLSGIRSRLFTRQGVRLNITGNANSIKTLQAELLAWITTLPEEKPAYNSSVTSSLLPGFSNASFASSWIDSCRVALDVTLDDATDTIEALLLPSKVAFSALSVRGSHISSPDHAIQTLLAHILRTGPLWEKIRMKGGAYGAGASLDGLASIFSFSSYRDPNIGSSFRAYREALEDISTKGIGAQDLLLAKIGIVGRDLKPLSPPDRAYIALRRYLTGIDDALRQKIRDILLAAKDEDIRSAAQNLALLLEKPLRTVMAGPEMVDKEEEQDPAFHVRRLDIRPL